MYIYIYLTLLDGDCSAYFHVSSQRLFFTHEWSAYVMLWKARRLNKKAVHNLGNLGRAGGFLSKKGLSFTLNTTPLVTWLLNIY